MKFLMHMFCHVRYCSVMAATAVIVVGAPMGIVAHAADVEGHWGSDVIRRWIAKGIAEGYPDGTFRPDENVSRA